MKTEGGKKYPKSAYAYTPSDNVSEWKLRIDDAQHTSAAVAALGKGYRGNKVQIPASDLAAVKAKVAAAYKKFFPQNDVPPVLKSVDVKINDAPVDGELFGVIINAIASFFRSKEWQQEISDDNEDYVEECLGMTCPGCGYDMTDVQGTVCPNCGCDTAIANDTEDATDSTDMTDMQGYMMQKSLNSELRQATYIVLEPDEVDLQGDTYTEAEVRKACHNFNQFCEKAYLDHAVETEDAKFVESYIAPSDLEINGEQVKKGTWLAVVQFEPEIWKDVKKGKYTGLSIGAYAKEEIL